MEIYGKRVNCKLLPRRLGRFKNSVEKENPHEAGRNCGITAVILTRYVATANENLAQFRLRECERGVESRIG
jgi:hypothetical protein